MKEDLGQKVYALSPAEEAPYISGPVQPPRRIIEKFLFVVLLWPLGRLILRRGRRANGWLALEEYRPRKKPRYTLNRETNNRIPLLHQSSVMMQSRKRHAGIARGERDSYAIVNTDVSVPITLTFVSLAGSPHLVAAKLCLSPSRRCVPFQINPTSITPGPADVSLNRCTRKKEINRI